LTDAWWWERSVTGGLTSIVDTNRTLHVLNRPGQDIQPAEPLYHSLEVPLVFALIFRDLSIAFSAPSRVSGLHCFYEPK
jgi:hypothetical protein